MEAVLPSTAKPGDDQHGVLPHIAVNDAMLAEFRGNPDPVLALALRHIRERRAVTPPAGTGGR